MQQVGSNQMAEFSVRDGNVNLKSPLQIPGIVVLIGSDNDDGSRRSNSPVLAPSLFLLTGPSGVGKSVYCKQLLIDAMQHGYHTMFLTAAVSDRQFKMLFPTESAGRLAQSCSFINP